MIRVNDKYVIQSDKVCYTVLRARVSSETGNEYVQPLSYHATLSEAFKSIVQREQRELVESTDMDLNQAIKEFECIQNEFCDILKGINEKESINA